MSSRAFSTLKLGAFYHVYAAGNWEEPLGEFLQAIDESGFDGFVHFGIVGNDEECDAVRAAIPRQLSATYATEGYEQVTLATAAQWAMAHDGFVLYAHTKGAARDYALQRPWRREETTRVVSRWRENLKLLEDHDVVGSSWQDWEPNPCGFPANFWMARCDYLRTLPAPAERRTAAETWLGLGTPRVHDLAPRRMRLIPTDGRNVDGGNQIEVPEDSLAIMITADGETVIAVQIVPREWLPDADSRMLWRLLQPAEVRAWKESYLEES